MIRKHGKKFQVLIRRKDSPHIIKSFVSKEAAREWARETEVNIERGMYANSMFAQRMTLGELLNEYRDRVSVNKKGYRTEMYRIGKITRHKVCKCTLFKLTKLKLMKFREVKAAARKQEAANAAVKPREENVLERINRINYEYGDSKKRPPHMDNKKIYSFEDNFKKNHPSIEAAATASKTTRKDNFKINIDLSSISNSITDMDNYINSAEPKYKAPKAEKLEGIETIFGIKTK